MGRQPADVELLVECAIDVGRSIGAPAPSRSAVLAVISRVVDERDALDCAVLGIITKDEAVNLLLAHFQSSLFHFEDHKAGVNPWSAPHVVDAVKRGLFGVGS